MLMIVKDIQGFSLIELIITVAIGGILTAIAVPSIFATMPTWDVNGAVRRISADMQFARVMAISQNRAHWIFFDKTTTPISYSIYKDDGDNTFVAADEELVKTVELGATIEYGTGSLVTVGPDRDESAGVSLIEYATDGISFTDDAVLFNNNGMVTTGFDTGTGVYLVPVTDVATARTDRIRLVAVKYNLTGATGAYRYNSGWVAF
jgi:prepilin-type N-terminal cleavage/methylation domain-containing protein